MARLAPLRCLAVVALVLYASFAYAYAVDYLANEQQKVLGSTDLSMPAPFEYTASVSSSNNLDDSYDDNTYIDDVYAADIDTYMPEELFNEFVPYTHAAQQPQKGAAQLQQYGASIPLPIRLPEDVTLFSTLQYDTPDLDSSSTAPAFSSSAAIGAAAADADISSELVLLSRLPVGMPLQQVALQPAVSLAADLINQVWQTVEQFAPFAVPMQQPLELQLHETVSDNSGSHDSSSSMLALRQQDQQQEDQQQPADMEISVMVESTRSQNLWSRLFSMLSTSEPTAAAMDSAQAAALAGAVVEALGRKSGGASSQEQQRMQDMVVELDATGSYTGGYQADTADLSATAAAAVAAAAASVMQNDPDWSDMEMDIQLTHTTQKFAATWGHILMLGAAMLVMHIGLCLLLAPLYARCVGSRSASADSELQQQQPILRQFIVSSGLKKAGMYKPLLSEEQEV